MTGQKPLIDPDDLWHNHQPYYRNIVDLESAARSECALCRTVCASLVGHAREPEDFSGAELIAYQSITDSVTDLQSILLHLSQDRHLEQFVISTPSHQSNAPAHTLTHASNWISECKSRHHACQKTGDQRLPTRLIDLGEKNTNELKLVSSVDIAKEADRPSPAYVAFSHCWGQITPDAQTTLSNQNAYRDRIPYDRLEQNCKDAVKVTRSLGYRYLWIDHLCIIQDDPSDWRKECSLMEAVYSDAGLTIAAAAATNCRSGFLTKLVPSGPICELQVYRNASLLEMVYIQKLPHLHGDQQLPLASRAWTFQERLLSRRVLFFGPYQTSFECTKHSKTETPLRKFELSTARLAFHLDLLPELQSWIKTASRVHHDSNWTLSPNTFYMCVEAYITRKITHADDVLPALSGIANRYHNATGDEYLAGHWNEWFVLSLCWTRDSYTTMWDEKQIPMWKSPSWSWASANAMLRWSDCAKYLMGIDKVPPGMQIAQLVDYNVLPVGEDRFGQVQESDILVKGHITKVCATSEGPSLTKDYLNIGQTGLYGPFAFQSDLKSVTITEKGRSFRDTIPTEMTALLLFSDGQYKYFALALEAVEGEPGTYRRVGAITPPPRMEEEGIQPMWYLETGEIRTLRIM